MEKKNDIVGNVMGVGFAYIININQLVKNAGVDLYVFIIDEEVNV